MNIVPEMGPWTLRHDLWFGRVILLGLVAVLCDLVTTVIGIGVFGAHETNQVLLSAFRVSPVAGMLYEILIFFFWVPVSLAIQRYGHDNASYFWVGLPVVFGFGFPHFLATVTNILNGF